MEADTVVVIGIFVGLVSLIVGLRRASGRPGLTPTPTLPNEETTD